MNFFYQWYRYGHQCEYFLYFKRTKLQRFYSFKAVKYFAELLNQIAHHISTFCSVAAEI